MHGTRVLIGVGNEYRRDDGIGPAVVAELERRDVRAVRLVVSDGEPSSMLEAWNGAALAVVVDAVLCAPSTPGRIHRYETGDVPAGHVAGGSHALGVPEALRLAQVLDRAPRRLVVYAVEAADVDLGTGLSPAVAEALPHVVAAVRVELGE